MMDKENNFITLAECPNPNVLVWGRSGQGKTYFFCREIEREVRKGKKVLIIDYSGSYTSEELEKNQIKIETIKVFNLAKTPFYWFSYYETEKEFSANLSDSLASVLNIDSSSSNTANNRIRYSSLPIIQEVVSHNYSFSNF